MSPSAREAGTFNWGSTLWHELAHTVTLGMTDHRIPRWFSEGLSVYEERQARPGWGEELSLAFLEAFLQERLHGIEQINDGFMRPAWPGQIQVSYYHASVICDWIAETRGFDAILSMLREYREGADTRTVLDRALGMEPKDFDEAFGDYVRERFAAELEVLSADRTDAPDLTAPLEEIMQYADLHPRDYRAQMTAGSRLYSEDRAEGAVRFLERARSLLPDHAAGDGPYPLLARIYLANGQEEEAAEVLERLVSVNEENYEAHLRYGAWLEEQGETEQAADVLGRAIYIYPFEAELHVRRANLLETLERFEEAVEARRAVVSLDPVDRAEALYRLAEALASAGMRAEARLAVLQSLEIAPTYEPALDLLLRLQPPPGTITCVPAGGPVSPTEGGPSPS